MMVWMNTMTHGMRLRRGRDTYRILQVLTLSEMKVGELEQYISRHENRYSITEPSSLGL
jgi:hypothetical protein